MTQQNNIYSYFKKSAGYSENKPIDDDSYVTIKVINSKTKPALPKEPPNKTANTKKRIQKTDKTIKAKSKSEKAAKNSIKKSNGTPKKASATSHCNFMEMEWYKNPKDINGNKISDKNYDPKALYIPPDISKNLPPAAKRYFEIKAAHWDCLVFFKMGKFYEIFDQDAVICHESLGLNYMRGDVRPHVGVPEKVYEKNAAALVALGYKVAKVDQVETVGEMEKRVKAQGGSKIVGRCVTQVITPGHHLEVEVENQQESVYLLSIYEDKTAFENADAITAIGICFCNSKSSAVTFGSLEDDIKRTKLLALMASLKPAEIVTPMKGLSLDTETAIKPKLNCVVRNKISYAIDIDLIKKKYFSPQKTNLLDRLVQNNPAFRAFSQTVKYFEKILVADEIFSMQKYAWYDSPGVIHRLCLNGPTLENLEIFQNKSSDWVSNKNTLFGWLNQCSTKFGTRKLRGWVSTPLGRIKSIEKRLGAVQNLIEVSAISNWAKAELKNVPDLENLLARAFAFSVRKKKAVYYENTDLVYLKMFDSIISGLSLAETVVNGFKAEKLKIHSQMLIKIIFEKFPDIKPHLAEALSFLNLEKSLKAERVIPAENSKSGFNEIENKLENLKQKFNRVLNKYRSTLGIPDLSFSSSSTFSYHLEISTDKAPSLPPKFLQMSHTKKTSRFRTKKLEKLSAELELLKLEKEEIQKGILRKIFSIFCEKIAVWSAVIECVAELDCLLAFYSVAVFSDGNMTRPIFFERSPGGCFLEFRGSWHPYVSTKLFGSDFVPNDVVLGSSDDITPKPRFAIVTGPNMGGKSTVLRQTAIVAILAHLGCYVPAISCRLSLVDKIFTRIGANDAILANKSTFFVELEETANILNTATENSLVILDELGRGTSTFDGTAIAYAVSEYISKKIKCRTLFSTHYHLLPKHYASDSDISLYHMAYEPTESGIAFLYRFVPGVCTSSHGLNCARLAGLDSAIIERAKFLSDDMSKQIKN